MPAPESVKCSFLELLSPGRGCVTKIPLSRMGKMPPSWIQWFGWHCTSSRGGILAKCPLQNWWNIPFLETVFVMEAFHQFWRDIIPVKCPSLESLLQISYVMPPNIISSSLKWQGDQSCIHNSSCFEKVNTAAFFRETFKVCHKSHSSYRGAAHSSPYRDCMQFPTRGCIHAKQEVVRSPYISGSSCFARNKYCYVFHGNFLSVTKEAVCSSLRGVAHAQSKRLEGLLEFLVFIHFVFE